MKISIHAPVKGATPYAVEMAAPTSDFNPRTREGCDVALTKIIIKVNISIHAPVKGATQSQIKTANRELQFQSTHP